MCAWIGWMHLDVCMWSRMWLCMRWVWTWTAHVPRRIYQRLSHLVHVKLRANLHIPKDTSALFWKTTTTITAQHHRLDQHNRTRIACHVTCVSSQSNGMFDESQTTTAPARPQLPRMSTSYEILKLRCKDGFAGTLAGKVGGRDATVASAESCGSEDRVRFTFVFAFVFSFAFFVFFDFLRLGFVGFCLTTT